jgi:integrase
LAIRWHMRPDNPCRDVARNKEHGRERYLSEAELARLLGALDSYRDQRVASIFRLLLLTGARRGEVLSLRWEDIKDPAVWTKPHARTKQRETHAVPLSAAAQAVLAELAKDKDEGGFVFPAGRGASGPMRTAEKPWRTICRAAGITGLRTHDLRHDYASRLVSAGVSLHIVGGLLGHKKPSTTARYAHLHDDALRAATEKVGVAISQTTTGGEIIPIRKHR